MKFGVGELLPLQLRHTVCRIRHYRRIQVFPCHLLTHSTNFTIRAPVVLCIHKSS